MGRLILYVSFDRRRKSLLAGGQMSARWRGTLSADGKTLTVESITESAGKPDKVIETWVRK